MALLEYAELADLEPFLTADEYSGLTADSVKPGLVYASYLVREATKNDVYSTDELGYAVNERKREGFRLATAQQVAFWVKVGVDLATVALGDATATPSVASTSINGATVQVDSSRADNAIAVCKSNLIPASLYYLKNAGLASHEVSRIYG